MLKRALKRVLRSLFGVLLFVLLWEGVVRIGEFPPFLLPGPAAVWAAFLNQGTFLLYHAGITAWETVLGFVFGVSAGALLAILLSMSQRTFISASAHYGDSISSGLCDCTTAGVVVRLWARFQGGDGRDRDLLFRHLYLLRWFAEDGPVAA